MSDIIKDIVRIKLPGHKKNELTIYENRCIPNTIVLEETECYSDKEGSCEVTHQTFLNKKQAKKVFNRIKQFLEN